MMFIVVSSSLASAVALLLQKFFQQSPALGIERRAADQLWPSQPGAPYALRRPPAPDRGVIARTQHRRHQPSLVHIRPRVVRPVQQTVAERFVDAGAFIAQRAGL